MVPCIAIWILALIASCDICLHYSCVSIMELPMLVGWKANLALEISCC